MNATAEHRGIQHKPGGPVVRATGAARAAAPPSPVLVQIRERLFGGAS